MPQPPQDRSIGLEGGATLSGLTYNAPVWGAAVNAYAGQAPRVADLYSALLFGTQGGGDLASRIGTGGAWNQGIGPYISTPFMQAGGTGATGGQTMPNTGSQSGLLGAILGAYSGLGQGALGGSIGDISQYGRPGFEAISGITPGGTEMATELNRQVLADLNAGDQLTPQQQLRLSQGIRSSQAARGMGYGPDDVSQEAIGLWLGGEELKRARQENARRQQLTNQATITDPFLSLVGRSTEAMPYLWQSLTQAQGQMPSFDPYNAYASDLYNTNYNAAWANVINARNVDAAKHAAALGLIGDVIGGAMGAAGAGCWIARAVYGDENPRWLMFRNWLFTRAHKRFFDWYMRNGPVVGALVRRNDWLKRKWLKFMESKIAEVNYGV